RPFGWSAMFGDPGPITERDVLFAKAMIIHHAGALDMAQAYNDDPVGQNTFLEMLNLDIVTDQAQEIALMQAVVDRYPGDAEAIVVDPSMVHGMSGHGQAGRDGHGASVGHEGHKEVPAAESEHSRRGAHSTASPSGGGPPKATNGYAPKADHFGHTRH